MRFTKWSTVVTLLLAFTLLGWISFGQVNRLQPARAESDYKTMELFTDVLSLVRKSYVEEVDLKDLIYGAIDGMLATLDPHSSFMTPEMYAEMRVDTKGEFGGLGIEITIRDGILTVVSPIEDTPAFKAGLKAGDQIIRIEEKVTKNMNIMEAVKLMRGPKGSPVTITVLRNGGKPKKFTIVRDTIQVRSVRQRVLEPGYGYVRVAQFQERTAEELTKALRKVRQDSGEEFHGLVLDLRNDPGGLLDQAVKVSDLFLEEGLIVYTEGREEGTRLRFNAKKQGTEPEYPMVVLINGGSASASEIVAGALRDHDRALIMGTQSFGKGSVQTIIPLGDDSGLRLTTARYFTPNGISIQATGITPDIVVEQAEIKDAKDEPRFREKDLENHFETPDGAQKEEGETEADTEANADDALQNDYQLMRALDLLKGWQIFRGTDRKAA